MSERWVDGDPLASVSPFRRGEDQEVAGLLAALLAYGRVDAFRRHTAEVLRSLGPHPADRLRSGVPSLPDLRYRFHTAADIRALLTGIRTMLARHGRLASAMRSHLDREKLLRPALKAWVDELASAAGSGGPGLRFLLSDPARGGACKRWLLYLRWMIRADSDGADTGAWSDLFEPRLLVIPLDTHIARIGRRLGLTARVTPDWRMAEEITSALSIVHPGDPVRYDLPLCHLGIRGYCPSRLMPSHCGRCPLAMVCPTAPRRARATFRSA